MAKVVKKIEGFIALPTYLARRKIKKERDLAIGLGILGAIGGAIYPPFAFGIASFLLTRYVINIYDKFQAGKKGPYYEEKFTPAFALKRFIDFAYEIDPDHPELEEHLNKIQGLSEPEDSPKHKEALKYLIAKAKKIKAYEPWRFIGLSQDQLTRHAWLIGTTGAGKSVLLITIMSKFAKEGGGFIYVDGKGDTDLLFKLVGLIQAVNRETDLKVLNLLKPDLFPEETNTFNPFRGMTGMQIFEMINAMAPEPSGDGVVWRAKAKVALEPVTFFFPFREKYFGEPFTFIHIQNALSSVEYGFLSAVVVALGLYEEDRIKNDPEAMKIVKSSEKVAPSTEYENMEILLTSALKNPLIRERVERLGYDVAYLSEIKSLYEKFRAHARSITPAWWEGIREAGKMMYEHFGASIKRTHIGELKRFQTEKIEPTFMSKGASGMNPFGGGGEDAKKYLAYVNPNADRDLSTAFQQHLYAEQDWKGVFQAFSQFQHIFASLNPEIKIDDIITNNQFLYVLLPAIEQSKDTLTTLGKMVVLAIRQALAISLGGKIQATPQMTSLLMKQMKPKPPFMVILDEYGSYALKEIEDILAQARSLGISVWIATQDFTSGRVGGTDEHSVKRLWANTNLKVILRTVDKETFDMLQQLVPEEEISALRGVVVDEEGNPIYKEPTLEYEKNTMFDLKKLLTGFANGMGLFIYGNQWRIGQVLYTPTPPGKKISLKKFVPIQ